MRKVLLALILGAIPLLAHAQGVPIEDLPLATTPLSSSDLFAVTQGNVFHKLPGTSLGLAAGLGTMSMQNANSVAITGGTITGVTIPSGDVTGLGTMATQNANAVAITGGTAILSAPFSVTDNKTGAIVADGAAATISSSSTYTSQQIYEGAIGPGPPTTAPAYDAVRGVMHLTASSTVITGTGVAGYVVNDAVIGMNAPTAAALYGVSISNSDNTSTWGINTICTDHFNQVENRQRTCLF